MPLDSLDRRKCEIRGSHIYNIYCNIRDSPVLPDRILFFVLALEKNCEIFIYVVLSFQFSVLNFALIYSLCLLFLYVFIFLLEAGQGTPLNDSAQGR